MGTRQSVPAQRPRPQSASLSNANGWAGLGESGEPEAATAQPFQPSTSGTGRAGRSLSVPMGGGMGRGVVHPGRGEEEEAGEAGESTSAGGLGGLEALLASLGSGSVGAGSLGGAGAVVVGGRRRRRGGHLRFLDLTCPVCGKTMASDEAETHLVMCLTRPRISYNEDSLAETAGECPICLEDMERGSVVARLPCLCLYHKPCIDQWFRVRNACPQHPGDD